MFIFLNEAFFIIFFYFALIVIEYRNWNMFELKYSFIILAICSNNFFPETIETVYAYDYNIITFILLDNN